MGAYEALKGPLLSNEELYFMDAVYPELKSKESP
jgi:hypothetical protein